MICRDVTQLAQHEPPPSLRDQLNLGRGSGVKLVSFVGWHEQLNLDQGSGVWLVLLVGAIISTRSQQTRHAT
jgi:hypothetical protein